MTETLAEYHRRRADEEMQEAALHANDITAEHHRRLAAEHRALAEEAEKAERTRTAAEQTSASEGPTGLDGDDDNPHAAQRSGAGNRDSQSSDVGI